MRVNPYLFEERGGEVSSVDGHVSQHPLLICLLQDVLLHSSLAYQPVGDTKKANMLVICCISSLWKPRFEPFEPTQQGSNMEAQDRKTNSHISRRMISAWLR